MLMQASLSRCSEYLKSILSNAIIVVISNPMDTMTYLSLKTLGLPKNRIIGMGGALDSSRFKYFLSQALGCNANEVKVWLSVVTVILL